MGGDTPTSSSFGPAGLRYDPYAALRSADYRNYALGNAFALLGIQMFNVAVGWELYQRTNSATALGLVGFFEVLPILLLAIPAGHFVDRYNRKTIIMIDQLLLAVTIAALATAALLRAHLPELAVLDGANQALAAVARFFGDSAPRFEDRHIPILYALIALNGVVRSVNQPAKQAMLPQLVPAHVFPNAVTWNSSLFEACTVAGPTLGGALLALMLHADPSSEWAYPCVYYLTALCQLAQVLFLLPVRLAPLARSREPLSLASLLAGFRFVYRTKVILASITLDMFAVLLGGATALLPMVAKEVLHVGPFALGALRAAPSIGAISMAMIVAHRRPMRHAGRNLLMAVTGFGLATIAFGLSNSPVLSFLMLALAGASDNISVIIRHTLVQVLTPNEMRGRVSAVNSVFISCSNELGAFESGLTAALFGRLAGSAAAGAVLAIVAGGAGTLLVVGAVAYLFPEIRRVGSLHKPS